MTAPGNISEEMQDAPKTQARVWAPEELAFALCFDVMASASSTAVAAIYSLLSPWGWSRKAIVERLQELQDDGLVVLENPSNPAKHHRGQVRATHAGEQLSNAYGLGSHRRREWSGESSQTSRPRGRPTGRPAPRHQPVEKESS